MGSGGVVLRRSSGNVSEHDAKPGEADVLALPAVISQTIGGTTKEHQAFEPVAPTERFFLAPFWSRRIGHLTHGIRSIRVEAPLHHIPAHIVESPGIRQLCAYRLRSLRVFSWSCNVSARQQVVMQTKHAWAAGPLNSLKPLQRSLALTSTLP